MKLSFSTLLLPAILAVEFLLITGISLPLAALNVYYRDVSQIWDLALQAGFFLCPIIYDVKLIPEPYLLPYSLNPMTRIVLSVRKILYYNTLPTLTDFAIPLVGGSILTLASYAVFRWLEPRFAEEL
jgi:ABC-type polysaccharide/polyol phosphate export permease